MSYSKKTTNFKHWLCWTKIYTIYRLMIYRCNYKLWKDYNSYWWRWITISDSWMQSPLNFYNDMFISYKEWLQLDRIDNNWNYCKENCRWVTPKENSRNRWNKIIMENWVPFMEYIENNKLNYHKEYFKLKKLQNKTKWI